MCLRWPKGQFTGLIARYVLNGLSLYAMILMMENLYSVEKTLETRLSRMDYFYESILKYFSNLKNFNSRYFPSLSIPAYDDVNDSKIFNCFFPTSPSFPKVTLNGMHHHGSLRLTSKVIFGNGYQHLLFSPPECDKDRADSFKFRLIMDYQHDYGSESVVEPYVPHCVVAPEAITVTFAEWEQTSGQHYGRIRQISEEILGKVFTEGLRKIRSSLPISAPTYLDFYPSDGCYIGMRRRIQFSKLDNIAYVQQLCAMLQALNNESLLKQINTLLIRKRGDVENFNYYKYLFERIFEGYQVPVYKEGFPYQKLDHMTFELDKIYALEAYYKRTNS